MARGKRRGRKRLRKWHKWPSIVLSLFALMFVLSGIVMNHRELVSSVDVPRTYLPPEYRYENWNNAAVRGACRLGDDSLLVYGNIGIWKTDPGFRSFSGFNEGFPEGIDNRKIFKVFRTMDGSLYAGTLFGLFSFDPDRKAWNKIELPVHESQVVDMAEVEDELFVLTRSWLLRTRLSDGSTQEFEKIQLPAPVGYKDKVGLFRTLWVIHSGEIGGMAGKLFVDLLGLLLAFLILTGIVYWLFPKWIKRRKKQEKKTNWIRNINRFSLKWHNRVGVWAVAFLLVMTVTGMFLRPPLLIPIATAEVGKIPFTVLDDPNPWHDKLRSILYDERHRALVVGTNKGIYFTGLDFDKPLLPFEHQPPVSVMGINVFEKTPGGHYLVGSFSGLYLWNPYQGWVIDYFSPGRAAVAQTSGPPIGDFVIAGSFRTGSGDFYIFDYNKGVMPSQDGPELPEMPENILNSGPMSLWNLALEIHTGRIYSFLFGRLYILFIPLFGLTMLVILVTGFLLWWKIYRKPKKS